MYEKVVKENPKIRSLNLQFTTFMIQGKIYEEVSESWSLLKFPQREREREIAFSLEYQSRENFVKELALFIWKVCTLNSKGHAHQ